MASKTSKQEILEPDRLQIFLDQARNFILVHKREIAIATAAVAAVAILGSGWIYYRQSREAEAMNLYNRAVLNITRPAMMGQDVAVIVKPLLEVATKYSGTEAASLSRYRIANAYLNAGRIDDALPAFQEFLKDRGGDSEIIVLTYNSLGYCYEAKRDFKNALTNYENALKLKAGKPFAGDILANMGRIYEALADRTKARECYEQALEKMQNPAMKLLISRKIAMLG